MAIEKSEIQLFEDKRIRTAWDESREEWLFSIVDVVGALTESVDSAAYWRKLKQRLLAEGNQTVTDCHGLKMKAADGKMLMISKAWTGMTTREHKNLKGLKKENLRDNMSTLELVLNMLAEATTTEISQVEQPDTFEKNKEVAQAGGDVAGSARQAIENRTGRPVITSKNSRELNRIFPALLEGESLSE